MSTRFVGTCPVCDARFKVRGGVLVHHGYRRPGVGYILGDCFAVGMRPHEVSPATAKAYLDVLAAQIANLEASKAQVADATELVPTSKPSRGFSASVQSSLETVHVKKGDPARYEGGSWIRSFDDLQRTLLVQLSHQLETATREAARMTRLIATWTEQPLTTVEEETARVTAEAKAQGDLVKADRDAKKAVQSARKADRDAKLAVKLEAATVRAQAILDAVDPNDARAVRLAYLKVLEIKLPASVRRETFYEAKLGRTELLKSAGLVHEHNGRLMTHLFFVRQLLR